MAEGLTKKQLKELRKLEKLQNRNLEQKSNNVKWIAISVVSAVFFVLFTGIVLVAKNDNKAPEQSQKVEIAETGHERMIRTNADEASDSASQVITIAEYADLQCPACKSYHPIVTELLNQYPDQVRLLFKHYPLVAIHPNARSSAIAAEAAARQDKFFEYVDLLYDKQSEWSALPNPDDKYNQYAQALGLNVEQFKNDRKDEAVAKLVDDQREEGLENGVTGTPTFFLEGERISSPASLDEFKKLVDAKLTTPAAPSVEATSAPTTIPDSLPLQQ